MARKPDYANGAWAIDTGGSIVYQSRSRNAAQQRVGGSRRCFALCLCRPAPPPSTSRPSFLCLAEYQTSDSDISYIRALHDYEVRRQRFRSLKTPLRRSSPGGTLRLTCLLPRFNALLPGPMLRLSCQDQALAAPGNTTLPIG